MQLSLVQFSAIAAGGLVAIGKREDGAPGRQEEGAPEPIELDLSEGGGQPGVQGLLHDAAEFLIISITGCGPKR
ncbi:MAG: hypothetical protein WC263_00630 [Candidatus Micrarchaeia archaeon]|jgi:hypothetical protein